jgi:protein TonB
MNARKASNHTFNKALFLAVVFHLTIVLYLVIPKPDSAGYQVLGQMQFDTYDPLGGMPGGEQAEAPPEAEPEMDTPVVEEPEPEPEIIDDPPQIIESTSEKAEVKAPPPPKPKEPPKEPPKPRPKPQPQRASAPSNADSAGQTAPPGAGGGPGTGQGGVGGGSGKGNPNAFAAYKTKVQRKLERSKKYPPSARNAKMEGTVTVRFTINRAGQVVQSQMVKSSGFPILDDEVMALLRRVNPFPEFPKEMTDSSITLTAPIRFSLKNR